MVVTREPEVLIREARRRTRRRRLLLAAGLVSLVAGAAALTLLLTSHTAGRSAAPGRGSGSIRAAGPTVTPKGPDALAVGPSGTLYVVDTTRDQVLRLLPSGRFAVFAGDGKHGFAGDGGTAVDAELRLGSNSTLAVARDGTVYIADTGNNRVRAVAHDGTIHTVARVGSPAGLAIGPHDRLYVGGQGLFRLSLADGELRRLLSWGDRPGHNRAESILSSSTLNDLAVDRTGDVVVVSFPGVFERTAAGEFRCLGSFRAGGQPAQLSVAPDGTIYGAAFSIFRLGPRALTAHGPCDGGTPVLAERGTQLDLTRRIDDALARAPGWRNLEHQKLPMIGPANGLAIASDGTIYYDSDFSYWAAPALVEVTPQRHVRVLWTARS